MDDNRVVLTLTYEERNFLMTLLAASRPTSHGIPTEKASDIGQIPPDDYERLWAAADDQLRSADLDQRPFTAAGLLIESRAPLARMRELGIVRTANAPAGDFAEWLVEKATGGRMAPKSQKGWDIITDQDERIQVKARFVSDPIQAGQRQLSAFRSFEFDSLVVVFLDDRTPVLRASCIPREVVEDGAVADDYVSAKRVIAADTLMDCGDDWTSRLQQVAEMHLSNYLD